MAAYQRVMPGADEYPGKHFVWTPASATRLGQLIQDNKTCEKVAKILNKEFPQPVALTKCSVIGKINRLRKAH